MTRWGIEALAGAPHPWLRTRQLFQATVLLRQILSVFPFYARSFRGMTGHHRLEFRL